jgi:hypothetical protein
LAKIIKEENHEHVFERLSDAAIFCACGEIVAAPPLAKPACCHGYHCYHWPNTVQWYPTWQPTWTVSSGATWNDTTVSYKIG